MSTYYVPGTVLNSRDTVMKEDKIYPLFKKD